LWNLTFTFIISIIKLFTGNTEHFLQIYQDDLQYVETTAYQKAMSILRDKHMVILIGHPGEGKTTMAARLALNVSHSPRNCLKLVTPSDWRKIDLSLKLFDTIIIDDIFGAGALDQKLVGDWRYHLNEIERAAKKKAVRVIITSRHNIYEESKKELGALPMFKKALLLTSSELTSDEKTKILKMQLARNDKYLEDKTIHECVKATEWSTDEVNDFLFGFPECASMFVRNNAILDKGVSFFKKPAQFIRNYLEILYKGNEQKKFLALVAVWASDNKKISRAKLRNGKNAYGHVKRIAEIFNHDFNRGFLDEILVSLDSHVGGYLVFIEATGEYAFSHNVIADMVGLVFGKQKPDEAVEICPRDFLMEFVSIEEDKQDESKVALMDRQTDCLIVKCVKMLLRDNCNQDPKETKLDEFRKLSRTGQNNNYIYIIRMIDFGIIKHKAFSSERFVKAFIDYIIEENLVQKCFSVPVMIMMGHFLDYGISMKQLDMCLMGYAWYTGATTFAKEVMIRRVLGEENVDLSVPFLLAVHSRQKDSVEFLLRHGAKVTGDAIYIASHKSIELLKILIQYPGTNVNDRGNAVNGNFPLIVAAGKGLTEAVKCMLNSGADAGVQNTAHMTALHKAIVYKHKDVIKLLIDAGAPLDKKGGTLNRTPLHLAVDLNEMELVEVLLEKGASLMVKDHRGQIPIHIAAIRGRTDILQALYLADPSQDKLSISYYGTESFIRGHSLFHIAVWKKNEELLDALIGLNADPNVKDFYDQTPLYFAIMRTEESFVNKLLNYGRTDKRKPQKQGFTPLHAAIHIGLYDIAKRLALDANVNAEDENGKTALHVACEKANVGLIQTLLAKGANPRVVTKRGETVYHILKRSEKKLSVRGCNDAQRAEQVVREFDPEFIEILPTRRKKFVSEIRHKGREKQKHSTMHSYESNDYLGACASIEDMYDNPKAIKKGKKKKVKKNMFDDYGDYF
jgi:ankyrin repeat protein